MPKKESSPTDSSSRTSPAAATSAASLPSAPRNIRRLDLPLEDIVGIRRKSIDPPPPLEDIVGTRRKSIVPPYLENIVVDTSVPNGSIHDTA